MPANHTGNPNAAFAPDGNPFDLSTPVEVDPVDGDGLNAASVQQRGQIMANRIAFLLAPFANGAAPNQIIQAFRTALLQTRSIVDHCGYRTGQIIPVVEDWCDVGKVLKNAVANGAWSGRWNYSISGPFPGRVEVVGPGDNSFLSGFYYPRTPCLKLSTGTGGVTPNAASVEMPFGPCIADDDGDIVMEWPFLLSGSSALNSAQGLTSLSQQGIVTEFVAQNVAGAAALVTRSGHANFEIYTQDIAGSGSHVDDTGVAKDDNPHHVRMEIRGANAADGSAAIVRLFLDGSHVVDRAVLIGAPAGGSTSNLLPFFKVQQTNTADHLWAGCLRFHGNTEAGDAIY